MATVPFQTSPQQELAIGSEVQFGATSVDPQRDVVSDDIARQGQAISNLGGVLNKLDNELNDAESKQLANNYYADAEAIKDQYNNLKGVNAVGSVTVDGKQVRVFDQYQNEMKKLLESYQTKASNGVVKYIFENKAQVYTKSFLSDMTTHSLKEQNAYNIAETKANIDTNTRGAINLGNTFLDPAGDFIKLYNATLSGITELAQLQGWETDPAKGLSDQYLNMINETKLKISKEILDKFRKEGKWNKITEFTDFLDPSKENKTVQKIIEQSTKAENEHDGNTKNNLLLSINGNQNNGEFLNNAKILLSLSSNQSSNDGKNAHVKNGLHSDEYDTSNLKQSESIDKLDKLRYTSIFYSPESKSQNSLLQQHKLTHLFAIQRIGVNKADSLYLKAKREYELPEFKNTFLDNKAGLRKYAVAKKKFEEEFLKNPDNKKIIDAAILDKYNEFIKDAAGDKFSTYYSATKTIFPNPPKRDDFLNTSSGAKAFSKAREKFLNSPANAIQVNPGVDDNQLDMMTGTKKTIGRSAFKKFELEKLEKEKIYLEKIVNDLQVIKKNVNYDYNPMEETIIVNEITGLQPKKTLIEKIKDTTKDPVQQKFEINDLNIKYEKIENENKAIYKAKLIPAKQISFAEKGGYLNLAANNININDFTQEDQKLLKEGQPEESNVDTIVELINDPTELRDNIDVHSHELSQIDYAELKTYSENLTNENNYVEATGNITMLKATLDRYDMGDLHTAKNKEKKRKYLAIHDAWLKEINARQISNNNTKLTMGQKQEALNYVLLTDLVSVDRRFGRDRTNVIPSTVEFDNVENIFVDVLFEGENVRVFPSKIKKEVFDLINASIRGKNKYPTQALISEYWLKSGKAETETQARKNLENYGLNN